MRNKAGCCCGPNYSAKQRWRIALSLVRDESVLIAATAGFFETDTQALVEGTLEGVVDRGLTVTRSSATAWDLEYEGVSVTVTHDFTVGPLVDEVIDVSGDTCHQRNVVVSLEWVSDIFTLPSDLRSDGFDFHHSDVSQSLTALSYSLRLPSSLGPTESLLLKREVKAVNFQTTTYFGDPISDWWIDYVFPNGLSTTRGVKTTHNTNGGVSIRYNRGDMFWTQSDPPLMTSTGEGEGLTTFFYDPANQARIVEWEPSGVQLGAKALEFGRSLYRWRYVEDPGLNPGALFDSTDIEAIRGSALDALNQQAGSHPGRFTAMYSGGSFMYTILSDTEGFGIQGSNELVSGLTTDLTIEYGGGYQNTGGFTIINTNNPATATFNITSNTWDVDMVLTVIHRQSFPPSTIFANISLPLNFQGTLVKEGFPASCF